MSSCTRRTAHLRLALTPKREELSLFALLALICFDLLVRALHTPLNTDELMARISAQSANLQTVLTLLRREPLNVDPPLFPIVSFLFAHLPVPVDLAVRIPSILGMCIAAAALFGVVRDWLGFGVALIAAELLASSPHAEYGAMARPYSLLIAALAAALLSWDRAAQARVNRRFWIVLLGISTEAAMLLHYYAAFGIVPIVLGELVRSAVRRAIDWAVWTSLAAAALVAAPIYAAFLPAGAIYRAHPFHPLRAGDLGLTFLNSLNYPVALTALGVAVTLRFVFRDPGRVDGLRPYQWVVASAFALSPLLVFSTAGLASNTFRVWHAIYMIIGVAILVGAAIYYAAGGNRTALLGALFISLIVDQIGYIDLARQPAFSPSSQWAGENPDLLNRYPHLDLVSPDFDFAMRTHLYGPAWLSSRLIMITSRESMLRFAGNDNAALAALAIHRWTGWPLTDYFQFRRTHTQFLLYGEYWMYNALKSEGAQIELLGWAGPYRLYLVNAPKL